jgi:hypothetical protein
MKVLKFYLSVLLLCFIFFSNDLSAQVLPSERSVDWTKAGLINKEVTNGFTIVDMQNFNVVNDGVTANDAFLSNALATVTSSGAILVFPSGDYLFNSSINLPSNVVVKGAGATTTSFLMDLSGSNHAIKAQGSLISSVSANFSQSGTKGDSFINVDDSSSFSVGDWVQIFQDDSSLITSAWAANTVGQILEITAIEGAKIEFSSALRLDFDIANSPSIKKINPVENVGIECLKIKRIDDTAPSQTSTIFFEYAVNSWVTGIESEKTTFSHVEAKFSSNLYIAKSYFHHAFDYGGNGRAYGVVLHYTTNESLVENNVFEHLRHSMLVQAGANGNVFAYNYSTDAFWSSTPSDAAGDIVLHGNYPHSNLFEHNIVQNIVIDNSHGPNGMYNTFLRNRAENYGIFFSASNSPGQNFIGNEIVKSSFPQNLVNYTILGANQFVHGNNNKGTIVPSGTSSLSDDSYFYDTRPDFISSVHWSSIGAPNVFKSGSNPSKDRYVSNVLFDNSSCNDYTLNIENIEEAKIEIYPNPVKSILVVNSIKTIINMKIVNQLGQTVFSEEIYGTPKKVDLSKLNSGIYFLKIKFIDGNTMTKKIIKAQ